ncbi:50S ribosomal protein L1 [Desulfosudis oleivorans]|jgi:large subunit ribosomal protein L1|uniref:Large ribosomal subunit protein uL1 n=1 Tax=Desulfosudis oleivorans (strain DSM 6200 / JCM 39069 / Hxd3) TaxID=96561 RepID=RL1_DESOH|nr:50S ribosomal protein L1 [Desulfosudis oleivorans]A8ZUU6.1 RecName: Full=Large ribosomal subunit protein uL1; AltName: Full=50S ribosomal protein L1 [Desulfosudis oleivorans Hxd3]ABW66509.1 ribosomal protein L1 [Desulfosudis oleivorans Hxd3]
MAKKGKKIVAAQQKVDADRKYDISEGIDTALQARFAGFDESVDIAVRLGVDPRHADQMVRGSVVLPHGTGKEIKILVFAKGEKEKEALDAGADFVGNDELIEDIKNGWFGFDKAVATPDMMGAVGKIGKLLGPRGLMPNAKTGTVTFDVARAVNDLKAGKIDFRVDKAGIVHAPLGKASFGTEKLQDNMLALLRMLVAMKPATSKGAYMRSLAVSTSMGAGVRLDPLLVKDAVK